jgi:DNA-binding XRE family transcriptional regulator
MTQSMPDVAFIYYCTRTLVDVAIVLRGVNYLCMAKKTKSYEQVIQSIASNIKNRRNELGYTQEEMAQKFDFNYRYYQKIEAGEHGYALRTLYDVAAALELEITDLFS